MPNFSVLAGLEVPEKFGVGWWCGFQVRTMSNPMKLLLSCFELSLSFYNRNEGIFVNLIHY